MDKTYILENNILERYVLGELNAEDTLQLEQILRADKDVKLQLNILEENFEQLALDNAIKPPSIIKEQVLSSVSKETTIPLTKTSNSRFLFNIAAGFAGLFLISSAVLYFQLKNTKAQLNVVETQNDLLTKDLEGITEYINTTEKWFEAIKNPNAEPYLLKGNALSPDLKLVSYVNHKNKSVIVNTSSLPKLDDKHDYQMWADVEGEMINMGIINSTEELIAMTYINDAESLNITIEPSGGNDHPTVSNLVTSVALR